MSADSSLNPRPLGNTPFDQKPTVWFDDPGDLIAAIPHLLGYHPRNALVISFVRDGVITRTLCSNTISDVAADTALAEKVLDTLVRHAEGDVIMVLVDAQRQHQDGDPPHAALINVVARRFADLGVDVAAFWTPGITEGARWSAYHDPSRTGTVPDPTCSPAAAAVVAQGHRTFADRAELAATLDPAPDKILRRRETRLLGLAAAGPLPTRDAYRLVADHVARAGERTEALTDVEVAQLAYALSDSEVRDLCLGFAVTDEAAAAERLWTELTRQSPAPERAQPAALLAMSAYVRGEGVLCRVALDQAQAALPDHHLAHLLREALVTGLPPATVRSLSERALDRARETSRHADAEA